MKGSGKRRLYPEEFKKEAVSLVTERGYTIVQAAQVVDTSEKNLQRWVKQQVQGISDERAELNRLRREVKTLRMEKEILKKASAFFAQEMK
ncbi:transposase and inactivated derivatives [Nitrosomonas sp. PY1]|uniref:transposase n=1 Tax=Nitrosomonas sp. PY1 TaxID=1803906 RepID=UPI001FC7D27B|nr:transposase [Nitrosomonas sp. PY1]GKS68590.1 transposase and inactivated derivatives [Nitrosomonas sp. PY1]GKS69667.1 transposase and inactivated derivatives [Nitrosomonas sp. PY1]